MAALLQEAWTTQERNGTLHAHTAPAASASANAPLHNLRKDAHQEVPAKQATVTQARPWGWTHCQYTGTLPCSQQEHKSLVKSNGMRVCVPGWAPALLLLLAALGAVPVLSYRVVQDDYTHDGQEPRPYFEPYHPGFVNVFGDATNPRR